MAQFKSLEKKIKKSPALREKNAVTIRDDILKGYVITVRPHSYSSLKAHDWYLPLHPMLKPNKPSNVIRVLRGNQGSMKIL